MSSTGTLLEVKRFAVHDGPGVRTTLFFKGCPLHCLWCHNPESISPRPQLACFSQKCLDCAECVPVCPENAHALIEDKHVLERERCTACGACETVCLGGALRLYGKTITVAEGLDLALEDREYYEPGGGVTLSGGEPLLQADFCRDLLAGLKQAGVHTAVDTCGCVNWAAFEAVLPFTDLFLVDFKHADSATHRRLTGQGNELIVANLRRLSAAGADIEIRMPLIPGCNDSDENLRATGNLLAELNLCRVKVLPYHAMARSKYTALGLPDTMPTVDPPDRQTLNRALSLFDR